ncbi:plasmid pRiA4b ORF-3 family protein (plasmid) [Sinorhizobium numidicum]|uniref:Plasmid pRiA4b ORF-3 family protein n=1 Tax=Sinorhizobium numidicum TaxID=680248 RepID=A0ABY8D5B2_9HYPH|nr:plasmid pRiA4b ORF-3 family protein [Sinorhizobium numidicum]WEX79297.1 plasmid pRiA4b ORF-3 family protein [Sinorhizobium numidicum]WEX85332.1 plasmid pRiA4b ORF-3 family protein [Sinorhizobium numidicum]
MKCYEARWWLARPLFTVMRRVVVPFRIKLPRLHEVLQAAMGWSNSHLYEFRIRDVGFGPADQDWGDGPLDARKISLLAAIEDIAAKSFKYLYDFGDGWTHSINIERTFPVIGLAEPMLLEATGRCPPEDISGPWGYQEFREALADPTHGRHAELVKWWGSEDYDPERAGNFAELNKAVDDVPAKWTRKSCRKI